MTKAPSVYISMPTYDLMQVSTCLSLVKLFNKFTIAKIKAEIGTLQSIRSYHNLRMDI